MRVRAPAVGRAVAGDEGERDQAAAARAFVIAESGRQQDLALVGTQAIFRECRTGAGRVQGGQNGHEDEFLSHRSLPARLFGSHAAPLGGAWL